MDVNVWQKKFFTGAIKQKFKKKPSKKNHSINIWNLPNKLLEKSGVGVGHNVSTKGSFDCDSRVDVDYILVTT